jgi:hypothetical protein
LKQHRALEDELVGVSRLREPVEESLRPVPIQDELKILVPSARQVEQPLPNGGCDVP